MSKRDSWRGIESDYYTHAHDLPPQIGTCYSHPEAAEFQKAIDGQVSTYANIYMSKRDSWRGIESDYYTHAHDKAIDGQVCTYVNIYILIYLYTSTYSYLYICAHFYMCVFICEYIYM